MTIDLQSLIEQRPHLKDPFEFYARWQRFQREADGILPKNRANLGSSESRAYPPDIAGAVLRSFASIFDLSAEMLAPLAQALEAGDIDFMRLPLGELPAVSLPPAAGEMATTLFLLSRPWFLRLREVGALDGREWEGGRCPLCSAQPALATIVDGPRRHLYCSWCGTTGPYRFIGCPNCENKAAAQLGTIEAEGEAGFRVATCDTCRTYVKVVEGGLMKEMPADLADLASLPLDIVAQEKGYTRTAPNPIGLKKIA
ncbi:MAG: formate dehydrogenase accessory protein FdhE [Deltaproteobacteria bacterium]|nr:formate dehydrogenase accessory protein FdhE [Deltaproteobacteria bacterium]